MVKTESNLCNRYVTLKDLQKHLGVGRPSAEKLAYEAKARCKIGTGRTGRVIYDLEKINKYIADHSL